MDAVIVYAGNIADLVGSAPPSLIRTRGLAEPSRWGNRWLALAALLAGAAAVGSSASSTACPSRS